MRVLLGNPSPLRRLADTGSAPTVTYAVIPDDYTIPSAHSDSLYPSGLAVPMGRVSDQPSRRLLLDGWMGRPAKGLPNHEALANIIDPQGVWANHSDGDPSWVWSDNAVLAQLLQQHYGVGGPPDDLERTHWTRHGPPGSYPDPRGGAVMLKVNGGQDLQSSAMGLLASATGTSTAIGASSLTDSGATWTVNQWKGAMVVTGGLFAQVVSNTSTILTLDRWYNPAALPATAATGAAATPSTGVYVIPPGQMPANYMGLGNTNTSPSASDTVMSGEIVTSGGGLIRRLATWAHTTAASSYTETGTFTANGSDSLPVTLFRLGIFQSVLVAVTTGMLFETLFTASATLSSIGDQATATDTVSQ